VWLGWLVANGLAAGVLLHSARPAQAVLPPNYVPIPGTLPLNPAHVGAVGSQFTQDCTGLPRPVQPGEVAWHFILSQSVQFDPMPTNVFNTLTVTFQSAGTVTLAAAVTDFGPPSNAHAYVFTPTDDILTGGVATIGREISAPAGRANDPGFNLSHTCASPEAPATTTSSTTTNPTSTTSSSIPTTTAATTTTTMGPASTTSGPIATIASAVGPASTSQLPHTGGDGRLSIAAIGIAASFAGASLALAARRWKRLDPAADDGQP
jgi:LPXTG-motif cell wall-anchored protein